MFIKTILVVATGLSFAFTLTPPRSSRTVSASKDKINHKGRFVDYQAAPYILVGLVLIETSVYLLMMYLGRHGYNQGNASMQQLWVLDSWHVMGFLVAVSAMALRQWTYRTLDRFFTVR